jgi:asparagine synthase (glutamine-hydrolysing)
MISDAPLAFALSGGIDSSAIVCVARMLYPDAEINTFSYISSNKSESEESWIDIVNERVGAISHKVFLDEAAEVGDFVRFSRHQGSPVNNTHFFAQYLVFKEASNKGFKVLLEGQGADEVMGGYDGYLSAKFMSIWRENSPASALRALPLWRADFSAVPLVAASLLIRSLRGGSLLKLLLEAIAALMSGGKLSSAIRYIQESLATKNHKDMAVRTTLPGLNEELWDSATRDLLPRLLRHGDHNAMAHGVENRVPFLGFEFSRFVLSLPHDLLVSSSGQTKFIFREAMRGIVPQEILNRTDKIGFASEKRRILQMFGRTGFKSVSRLKDAEMRQALFDCWSGLEFGNPEDSGGKTGRRNSRS